MAKTKKKEVLTPKVVKPKVWSVKKGMSITSPKGILKPGTVVNANTWGVNGAETLANLIKAGHVVEATE